AAAEPHVTAAVHHERVVTGEACGQLVREHAFGDSARVEHDAARTRDRAGTGLDPDLRPAPLRVRTAGAPRRSQRKRFAERPAAGFEVLVVAGLLDLANERRVDETFGRARSVDAALDYPAQHRAHGHARAWIRVEPGELAV